MNLNMAYRQDVIVLYKRLSDVTQATYQKSTEYLLSKGILTLPPNVTMPNSIEFVNNTSYLKGFTLFGHKRALNTIEVGLLHHGIETNNIGNQLITGFAQCAKDEEVKSYFIKGKELALKQIKAYQDILLDSDVPISAASGSSVTNSTMAPFSEKLMLFCIYLLNGFGIVANSFGTIFTLRNDVSFDTALFAKDIYTYANDGIKLMIKKGWLEEPPQMEDRPHS